MTLKAMKAIVVNPNVYSSRFVSFNALGSGGGGSAIVAPSSGCDRVSVDSMLNAEARRGARWIRGARAATRCAAGVRGCVRGGCLLVGSLPACCQAHSAGPPVGCGECLLAVVPAMG